MQMHLNLDLNKESDLVSLKLHLSNITQFWHLNARPTYLTIGYAKLQTMNVVLSAFSLTLIKMI